MSIEPVQPIHASTTLLTDIPEVGGMPAVIVLIVGGSIIRPPGAPSLGTAGGGGGQAVQGRGSIDEYNLMTGDLQPGEDEIFGLELGFRKLSLLYKHHDLGQEGVWESMLDIVRAVDYYKEEVAGWEPEVVIMSALLGSFYGLMWDKRVGRREGLGVKVDRFILSCRELVVHAQASNM
jgi:hypothetical protein